MIAIIGHSNWKQEDFIAHLKASGVTLLVDVRSKPMSRFCPWFNQTALEYAIKDAGLQYRWRGQTLGGFSTGENMAQTLDGLIDWAGKHPDRLMAFMCSERKPQDCHRFWWLARYVLETSDQQIRSLTVHSPDWYPTLKDFDDKDDVDWHRASWLTDAVAAKKAA